MNGIKIFVIYYILLVKVNIVESGKPPDNVVEPLDKTQVLNMLDNTIKEIIAPGSGENNNEPILLRYLSVVKSLSVCTSKGDLTKQELVSCLNNIMDDDEMIPPPEFLQCLGEYLMCTTRACLTRLDKKQKDNKLITCIVECLPSGLLCVARSSPVPQRYRGL